MLDRVSQGAPAPSVWRRLVAAYRQRGVNYICYKILKRMLQDHPWLARHVLYRSPRWYWEQRGGRDYYREQEAQVDRSIRSEFIAEQIARYQPESLLEIGCGYGKQLAKLRARITGPIVGVDWSRSQLDLAKIVLKDYPNIALLQVDGARLPFADGSFDAVLTSAVILHNAPHIAAAIRREICRVGRRWAMHNEDTNISFSRFGYDTADEYRRLGYQVIDCAKIPGAVPQITQFCVVDLQHGVQPIAA